MGIWQNKRSNLVISVVFIFILIFCFEVFGDTIYFYKDKDGGLHFTDMPNSSKFKPYISYQSLFDKKKLFHITKRLAKKYKVDPYLILAIMKIESNMDINAVSKKGAQGLMQIMPSTQKEVGVYSPFDPEENIEGGIRYFKYLLNRYKDIKLAVAAYNAGPGAVDKYGGIPPYKETKRYVRLVIKEYNRLKRKSNYFEYTQANRY